MGWRRATFKGKSVWAAVDPEGALAVAQGRVLVRYSKAQGATLYPASTSSVRLLPGAVEALPEGAAAGERAAAQPPRRGSGFGSAGTRTQAQAAMAAEAARALIDGLGPEVAIAFTDGACKGNPGPAGAGAWVRLPDGRTAEVHRALGVATNNVGELTAIGLALDVLDGAGAPGDTPAAFFTDSEYAEGLLARGWKAKANSELVTALRERLAARPGVRLHWIAGHVGVEGNERADALANLGVAGRTGITWR